MPSLVNLSHVCSHLQNASLARLGLTSIPYTRLHLSLALLLHKQGFISYVKLAGASPPASCFPAGTRFAPQYHSDKNVAGGLLSGEAALQRLVRDGVTEDVLRKEGYSDEAVAFALSRRLKTKAQLERDGWDHIAADFLLRHDGKPLERLQQQENLTPQDLLILDQHKTLLEECKAEVEQWYGPFPTPDQPNLSRTRELRAALLAILLRRGFAEETLRHFAGAQHSLVSERELALDGVDLDVMGLNISNQPLTAATEPLSTHTSSSSDQDPDDLETEGIVTQSNRASRRLWLGMKYHNGSPVLSKARMISKPTKRIELDYQALGRLVRGKEAGEVKPLRQVGEIMPVRTRVGLVDVREAVERKVGGMVLCRIW